MAVYTERCDNVVTIIISSPERRNAIDPEHADALHQAFLEFDADSKAHVAVLWGEGGAFCAGADLKSLAEHGVATPEKAQAKVSAAHDSPRFCPLKPSDRLSIVRRGSE